MTTRRQVLIGASAATLASAALGNAAMAAPRPLNAYFCRGRGAASMIANPEHKAEFAAMTAGFAGGTVTVDNESDRATFLQRLFASDIAYLSLHANQRLLVVGNGDRVTADEVSRARQAAGRAPKLVIVAGCKTTGQEIDVENVPQGMGFDRPGKQAYIGFHKIVIGISQDRFFRYFLPLWLNPGPNNAYRTLAEAKVEAKALMERRYETMKEGARSGQQAGAALQIMPMDLLATGNFDIVGDAGLRATDL